MKRLIVFRMKDTGCVQNILPLIEYCARQGIGHKVFVDRGSMAEEKMPDSIRQKTVPIIPTDALVVTCLPLGNGFDQIIEQQHPVVLVQENPDPNDVRFAEWMQRAAVLHVCGINPTATSLAPIACTGLPVLDQVVSSASLFNRDELLEKMELDPEKPIVSLAVPGTSVEALRSLVLASGFAPAGAQIVARCHPALLKDPDFDSVNRLSERTCVMPIDEANAKIGPVEAILLTCGPNRFFVGTYDTTMNWQAAAIGCSNIYVIPPAEPSTEWFETAPILQNGIGTPLTADMVDRASTSSLPVGGAVERIIKVVQSHTA